MADHEPTKQTPEKKQPPIEAQLSQLNLNPPQDGPPQEGPPPKGHQKSNSQTTDLTDNSAFDVSGIDYDQPLLSRAKAWDGINQGKLDRFFSDISETFEAWRHDDGADKSSDTAADLLAAVGEVCRKDGFEDFDPLTRARAHMWRAELTEDAEAHKMHRNAVKVLVEQVEQAARTNGLGRPLLLEELQVWSYEVPGLDDIPDLEA